MQHTIKAVGRIILRERERERERELLIIKK